MSIQETQFLAEAYLLGDRIDLKSLEKGEKMGSFPLTLKLDDKGIGVFYRYGVVVFFNATEPIKKKIIKELETDIQNPKANPEHESLNIKIGRVERDQVTGNGVILKDISVERLKVVADILAKSVILDSYELKIASSFDKIEPLASRLEKGFQKRSEMNEVLEHIGAALLSEQRMVGRVEISEKPEVLWDCAELERLYARLEDEFEIIERYAALERKLGLVSRTAETLLDLIQARQSSRLEWYIIIMIGIEIAISLYDLIFIKLHHPL